MSGFRFRGISVVIDTTEVAEFDIADLRLSDEFLEIVTKNFTEIPFSKDDTIEGNLRARTIREYDFFFIVGRLEAELVVTIGGVQIHEGESKLRKALKIADKVGILRGATGL